MRLDRNQCELNVGIERIDEGRKNELCKIDRSLLNDSSRASNNANNQLESISYVIFFFRPLLFLIIFITFLYHFFGDISKFKMKHFEFEF